MSLVQVQKSLAVDENQVGWLSSSLRIGSLLSVMSGPVTDILGRRGTIIVSFTSYSIFSALSAMQYNPTSFAICQMLARFFLDTQSATSATLLIEEFDADKRGWGIGVLSSISCVGSGVALIDYAFMEGNEGWRTMYLFCGIQLPFVYYIWKHLPESDKFLEQEQHIKEEGVDAIIKSDNKCNCCFAYIKPVRLLLQEHPGRLLCCALVSIFNGFAFATADLYRIKYMEDVHDFTVGQASLVLILTGLIAITTLSTAGKLSDKHGRKKSIILANIIVPLGMIGYYSVPNNWFLLFSLMQTQGRFALIVVMGAFFAEMFPTHSRGTAILLVRLFGILGEMAAIAWESVLYDSFQSHYTIVNMFVLPAFLSPLIVAFYLPETSNRNLDDISNL